MSASSTTFSFPLRSLDASLTAARSPFFLQRFHGDEENILVRRWCDGGFMSDQDSPWPLVLYGPSGVGKSALAETLACRIKLTCRRLSGDEFRRQFLMAVATKSITAFREKIRSGDMLLLDELSLPDDEPALIREMVQLINFYREKQRPVIVTLQQAPCLMGSAFASLRSRLSVGLVIQIKRPGIAARREIAVELLKRLDLKIIDEDLDWLVRLLPDTPPMIRSYMLRVALQAEDSLLTRATLRANHGQATPAVDPLLVRQIVKLVARQLGPRVPEIMGKSRRQEVVRARSVAMYLTRKLLGTTFRETGDLIGRRDPSTVRHACRQIQDRLSGDPELAHSVTQVTTGFRSFLDRGGDNLSDT